MQGDLFRSYFRLLISDRIPGRTVNAVDQFLVEITDTSGQLVRIEFDPQTGLPLRATYDVAQPGGAPLSPRMSTATTATPAASCSPSKP